MKFQDISKKGGVRFQFKDDVDNGISLVYMILRVFNGERAFVDMENGSIIRASETDFYDKEVIIMPSNKS